jgi:pyridoxal phosphate enzyme (YggS family)
MDRLELIEIRLNLIKRDFPVTNAPKLIAVSKKYPIEDIIYAYESGQRDFGENRVDELIEKSNQAIIHGLDDIKWHFIGNLQTNKVSKLLAVPKLVSIHSVDSNRLLDEIIKLKNNVNNSLDIFLQVNTSDEVEKSGFKEWDDLAMAANHLLENGGEFFNFKGLMTMSRLRTENFEVDAGKCFKQLRLIKDSLEKDFDIKHLKLSMGMTSDYKIAMKEGTHFIRIGSKIFEADQNERDD